MPGCHVPQRRREAAAEAVTAAWGEQLDFMPASRRTSRSLNYTSLGIEPLQLGDGGVVLDEARRAGAGRGLEGILGQRAVVLQQVPLADEVLRLAAVAGPVGGGERGLGRAPAEEQLDDGVGPGLGLETV